MGVGWKPNNWWLHTPSTCRKTSTRVESPPPIGGSSTPRRQHRMVSHHLHWSHHGRPTQEAPSNRVSVSLSTFAGRQLVSRPTSYSHISHIDVWISILSILANPSDREINVRPIFSCQPEWSELSEDGLSETFWNTLGFSDSDTVSKMESANQYNQ